MRQIASSLAILAALSGSAAAQQQPDQTMLMKIIPALQQQRNAALDGAAGFEARVQIVTDENAKLKARVKELEDKYEPKDEPRKH